MYALSGNNSPIIDNVENDDYETNVISIQHSCFACDIDFSCEFDLYEHLKIHITQPSVYIRPIHQPPLKITLKSRSGNNFVIINKREEKNINLANHAIENDTKSIDENEILKDYSENEESKENNITKKEEERETQERIGDYDQIIYEEEKYDEKCDEELINGERCEETEGIIQHVDQGEENNLEEEIIQDEHHTLIEENVIPEDELSATVSNVIDEQEEHAISCQETENEEENVKETENYEENHDSNSPNNSEQYNTMINNDLYYTVNEINDDGNEYRNISSSESTTSTDTSTEYPRIRIKTKGLLKDPLTITEITDENPDCDPMKVNSNSGRSSRDNLWHSSVETSSHDGSNIMSLFNNNERAKDLGFTTSDSEYISLDRLEESNNKNSMLQLYNSGASSSAQNPLNSLTGLPMEALAHQVSRLQPPGNGMHQQNVLINIQQFQQPPPSYQPPPPPLYHHPPPPQSMYPTPYAQYQAPNPMYYSPNRGYPPPPHLAPAPPPPQPQMNPMQRPPSLQSQMNQTINQSQITSHQQQQSYRHSMSGLRHGNPRQLTPGQQRMQLNQQRHQTNTAIRQQMMMRQRAPMIRQPTNNINNGRNVSGNNIIPGIRPRGLSTQNANVRPQQQQQQPRPQLQQQQAIKRTSDQAQTLQAKKKRLDVLSVDKDDDDCQVICMQPKNTDGGLPQIESVQGGASDPVENNIMHLSDSITLSVRNNVQTKPNTPKKSDAKAVANILATRGITVTATPKAKQDKQETNPTQQKKLPALTAALNLNGAVSIIPSNKNNNAKSNNDSNLQTVDLTDDNTSSTQPPPTVKTSQQQQPQQQKPLNNNQRTTLPFKCDLCPAQYPNAIGLSKHRQNYHKTTGGMCELGIPLINLKQPGIYQKLCSFGILNYIPLPAVGSDGCFALPIINSRNPGNVNALGSTSMLTLGPIRTIPRQQNNVNNTTKPTNQK